MITEHKLFICDCNSPDHQLIVSRFTYRDIGDYEDTFTETKEIYFTVGLVEDLPFFKRLWVAMRYLFKKRNHPYQFEVILDSEKTKELISSLQ